MTNGAINSLWLAIINNMKISKAQCNGEKHHNVMANGAVAVMALSSK